MGNTINEIIKVLEKWEQKANQAEKDSKNIKYLLQKGNRAQFADGVSKLIRSHIKEIKLIIMLHDNK